jgi:hypothetical protein
VAGRVESRQHHTLTVPSACKAEVEARVVDIGFLRPAARRGLVWEARRKSCLVWVDSAIMRRYNEKV